MKRILILGGGFGGIYAAIYLQKYLKKAIKAKAIELCLVNKENYFVYQPMLPEVVSGSVGIFDTVSPIQRLLPKTKLYVREIEKIDLANKQVLLVPQFSHATTPLSYDHLVIALGNITDFKDNAGMHEHALPFKNLADAITIRNRVIDAVGAAANESDPALRQQLLTFVIGGGGFSGTEVCAEVNDFAKQICKEYEALSPEEVRVVLVHKKFRLFDGELPESLGNYAGKLLAKRGVDIRFGQKLIAATPEGAILDDQSRISSKTVISSVPSSPNPLVAELDLPKIHGRIKTNRFMQAEGQQNIWALGDCAMIPLEKENEFCPPTAQFAIREAKRLAQNIKAELEGGEKKRFHFSAIGMLGALGHRSAVAEFFGKFKFSGFFAWVMWRFIYWIKLPGLDRKIKVAVYWFLDLFIPPETVQLKLSPSQGIAQLHFEPGEIIFNEGDTGDFLYIITQGEVEVYNRKGHLANLGPGQYFGEMALLREAKRNATIKCTKATNVLALSKKDFGTLVANFKELKQNFDDTDKLRSAK